MTANKAPRHMPRRGTWYVWGRYFSYDLPNKNPIRKLHENPLTKDNATRYLAKLQAQGWHDLELREGK